MTSETQSLTQFELMQARKLVDSTLQSFGFHPCSHVKPKPKVWDEQDWFLPRGVIPGHSYSRLYQIHVWENLTRKFSDINCNTLSYSLILRSGHLEFKGVPVFSIQNLNTVSIIENLSPILNCLIEIADRVITSCDPIEGAEEMESKFLTQEQVKEFWELTDSHLISDSWKPAIPASKDFHSWYKNVDLNQVSYTFSIEGCRWKTPGYRDRNTLDYKVSLRCNESKLKGVPAFSLEEIEAKDLIEKLPSILNWLSDIALIAQAAVFVPH
jgi:hypothetical protein